MVTMKDESVPYGMEFLGDPVEIRFGISVEEHKNCKIKGFANTQLI